MQTSKPRCCSDYAMSGRAKVVGKFASKFNSDESYRKETLLKLYPKHAKQSYSNFIGSRAFRVENNQQFPLITYTAVHEEDEEKCTQLRKWQLMLMM